jgi:mannose-1-phosphate guanylyltransferase
LAGVVLRERDPHAIMAVLTSDHFIGNEEKFRRLLLAGMQVALDGYLVTLGITPTSPSSGYGYIQRGEPIGTYDGLNVYRVLRFKEKPDEVKARIMLESGDHAWNSGMFIWQVSQIMAEFARQMPDLSGRLEEISLAWNTTKRQDVLDQNWPSIKAETIDYGIMENAQNVAVIPAKDLNWSDVGSWDSLFDVLSPDQDGNIVLGEGHIGVKTTNSLIYVKQKDRLIVTIGVEDLVLVDTGDVILVCGKSEAQNVRQVVDQLQQEDQDYV